MTKSTLSEYSLFFLFIIITTASYYAAGFSEGFKAPVELWRVFPGVAFPLGIMFTVVSLTDETRRKSLKAKIKFIFSYLQLMAGLIICVVLVAAIAALVSSLLNSGEFL